MCSQADVPPYDIPEPQPPRVYRLAGDAPEEPRGSVALAVLGEMLSETEWDQTVYPDEHRYIGTRLAILREVRDRLAAAERGQ